MAIYDLYGIRASSLSEAKEAVERILSVSFVERTSSYHRGAFFSLGNTGSENFELKINIDPFEDFPVEEDFSDYEFLLYINNTNRSDELKFSLTRESNSIAMLRHEELQ